jgi:nitrile hydratase accessory protein
MAEPSGKRPLDTEGPAAPPRSNGELVFSAPWESRLFGISVVLHERGLLDWDRFRERLIAEIRAWESANPGSDAYRYYERWQVALEGLLAEDGLCAAGELEQRSRALSARPHGHDH